MSAFLAYSYSTGLTEKEQTEINEKTKKSREEFTKGFVKGASFSLAAYSLYSLTTSAAYAADSNVPVPKPPGDNGPGQQLTPASKPGFTPLNEGMKGAFVGAASGICGVALPSGDFYIGLGCAFLLIIGGIIINRK